MHKPIAAFLLAVASLSVQAQTFGAFNQIWQQRSMYRNIIVLEGNGHRCLTFGKRSARQSCMEMANPNKLVVGYTQRMLDTMQFLEQRRRVLVIGIGGGSLPMALRHHYSDTHVDAVELDQEVINVAHDYFKFKPDEKLTVYAVDGRVFIRMAIRQGVKYDAIMLDAFDKDYIPEHMASAEFLRQIQSALTKEGVVVANTYQGTEFSRYEEATYQNVFGTIYESLIPNGNRIILAGPRAPDVAAGLDAARAVQPSTATVMTDRFSPANALLAK